MNRPHCRHCWHSVDMGDGERVRYCCHCGGCYRVGDWKRVRFLRRPHGPFGAATYPDAELSFTWWMQADQMAAMGFARIPRDGEGAGDAL